MNFTNFIYGSQRRQYAQKLGNAFQKAAKILIDAMTYENPRTLSFADYIARRPTLQIAWTVYEGAQSAAIGEDKNLDRFDRLWAAEIFSPTTKEEDQVLNFLKKINMHDPAKAAKVPPETLQSLLQKKHIQQKENYYITKAFWQIPKGIDANETKLYKYIAKNQQWGEEEIAKKLKMDEAEIGDIIWSLKEKNLIITVGSGYLPTIPKPILDNTSFLTWLNKHKFKYEKNVVPRHSQGKHGRVYFSTDNELVVKLTAREDDAKACALVVEHMKRGLSLPVTHLEVAFVNVVNAYAIMQERAITKDQWEKPILDAVDIALFYLKDWVKDDTDAYGQIKPAASRTPRTPDSLDTFTSTDPTEIAVDKYKKTSWRRDQSFETPTDLEAAKPMLKLLFHIMFRISRVTGILPTDMHDGNIGLNPKTGNMVVYDLGFGTDIVQKQMPTILNI